MFNALLTSRFQGNGDKARAEDDLWTRRVRCAQIAYIKKNASTHGSTRRARLIVFARRKGMEASNFEISRNDRRSGMARPFDAVRAAQTRRSCSCSEYIILVLHRGRPRPRTKRPGITKTTYIFSTQFQTLKGKRDLRLGSCINYTFHKHDVRGVAPPLVYSSVPRVRGLSRRYVGSEACVIKLCARHCVPRNGGARGFPAWKLCA